METVLIEWTEGCGKPERVGHRMRMGEAQATNQIAKGRAILVDETAKPKRSRKRAKAEETDEAEE